MTNADFFAERWESEQKAFRRVLDALPGDQLSYKPHERSTGAGDLAWQLANEQHDLSTIIKDAKAVYVPSQHPSKEEILAAWDRNTEEVRKALAARDDSAWDREGKFMVGDEVVWPDTVRNLLWGFLFDMVHHRGQLSAYIRPMGGKVPAIYGPSGDER
jgi:uncharacterized damage-inducible protein DinB